MTGNLFVHKNTTRKLHSRAKLEQVWRLIPEANKGDDQGGRSGFAVVRAHAAKATRREVLNPSQGWIIFRDAQPDLGPHNWNGYLAKSVRDVKGDQSVVLATLSYLFTVIELT